MAFGRRSAIVALIIAAVLCGPYLLTVSNAPDYNSADGDHYRVDWGQKAHEIAVRNQTFIELTGDQQQAVSGIIWEESHAYKHYRADGRIYNVSVDFQNDKVTSIEEVKMKNVALA